MIKLSGWQKKKGDKALAYLRRLARCRSMWWRCVSPRECAWSMAAVVGSRWPRLRAHSAHTAGYRLGEGKWCRANQAERNRDRTLSMERPSAIQHGGDMGK